MTQFCRFAHLKRSTARPHIFINNDRLDLLPAWACMGVVHSNAKDPYPRKIYLFIMDAPPKLMEGVSERARKASARLRADEWMRWHLAKVRLGGGKPHHN